MNNWEVVHSKGSAERTERLRVPGGWLWRTRLWDKADGTCVGLTFQPDAGALLPEHRTPLT